MPTIGSSSTSKSFGPPRHSPCPKFSGGTTPVCYEKHNFKDTYLDEYTGEVLPTPLIRAAIEDELDCFNSKVWQLSTVDDMKKEVSANH